MIAIYDYCCSHWHSLFLIIGIIASIWLVYRKYDKLKIGGS